MSNKSPEICSIRPSTAASITHALCATINDLVHEAGSDMSRHTYLKLCGLATAVAVFSNQAARFHFNLLGDDHDLLEAIEDRYAGFSVNSDE